MADTVSYRPDPSTIPSSPGVYTFRDAEDRVLYVGKAKNIRSRLSNYFQDLNQLHPRTRAMVLAADHVQWTVVANEVEALNLEYTWIKRYNPRYNVIFRDDKSYPMLAISVKESIPRIFVYRGVRKPGIRYFGPYPRAWALRETVELLTKIYPVRTCSSGVFRRHKSMGRPCLLGYIDRCSAPCTGKISAEDHRIMVNNLISFMSGNTESLIKNLTQEMLNSSEELDFERAAQLRDQLQAIDKAMEKQAVVFTDTTDADLIALHSDELETAVHIFHVRRGRIMGQRAWVVAHEESENHAQILRTFITQFYGNNEELAAATELAVGGHSRADKSIEKEVIPREVLVSVLPDSHKDLEQWMSSLRESAVHIRVPQRGDKKSLMETATTNATQVLARHKMARSTDIMARTEALEELRSALMMSEAPMRIECVDISHIQGTDVVASLVVFEDGLPQKSDYRTMKIREAAGEGHSNDVASIAEVARRRFQNTEKLPQLFLVDGGKAQVEAAAQECVRAGIDSVMVCGIAKRLEELWLPGEEYPVILARNSEALYLVQRIRDESHRVAISFHRKQRAKRMTHSALDSIPGLGERRRQELLKSFGSLKKIKAASATDIARLDGFGPVLAEKIVSALAEEDD